MSSASPARELFTPWVVLSALLVVAGVALDATAFATEAWGEAREDTFYTYVGIYRLCNGSREVTRRDKLEIWHSEPDCFFPTEANLNWLPVGLGLEYVGALCALASLAGAVAMLVLVRVDWMRSRGAVVALIPMSALAGFFNLVGVVVIAYKLDTLPGASARWSLYVDAGGVACFLLATITTVLELQGVCLRHLRRHTPIGRGLLRPI